MNSALLFTVLHDFKFFYCIFFFRFSLSALEFLVRDLIRLLQILHGSVHDAFNTSTNHKQLDCFFALLHQSEILNSKQTERGHSLTQSVEILPLPNEIKVTEQSSLIKVCLIKCVIQHLFTPVYYMYINP